MINAKYRYKEDASASVYRFGAITEIVLDGDERERERIRNGTVLTTLRRFHGEEAPIRPKLHELCIKSREERERKDEIPMVFPRSEEEPRIYKRKWKWNSRKTVMRIEQTRESRAPKTMSVIVINTG